MAKKPKIVKSGALPALPFSVCDRGAFINRPWVVVAPMGKEYLAAVYYDFASGHVMVAAVGVHEIAPDWQTNKPFCLDGRHTGFGPEGLAQTHLQWLKNQALQSGATPDAIRFLADAIGLSKKEESDMAKAATKTKATKPVGKGGKLSGGKAKGGNTEALAKAREAAAAKNAANDAMKITVKAKPADLKLRGGRKAKFEYIAKNKPKTVGDVRGTTVKDDEGGEHVIDMGALRGMEKRGHIALG